MSIAFGLVSHVTKSASHLVTDVGEDVVGLVTGGNDDTQHVLPGCEIIGSGYDVLNGFYADSRSCLNVLFRFSKKLSTLQVGSREFSKPEDISYHSSHRTDMFTASGNTIEEFTKSVNSNTKVEGEYNFFSGSVEADIGESSAKSSNNSYSKVNFRVDQYTLQLPPKHREYLIPKVKKDIDEMSDFTKLFDTYGTHYLAKLIMGGTAIYTAVTKKSTFSSKFDLSVVAKMSYKFAVGSASVEEKATYGSSVKNFNESSEVSLKTKGGNPSLGGSSFPEHADEWSGSVSDYLAFIDFLGDRSLIGIWELASTRERSDNIKKFYSKYCEDKQKVYIPDGPALRARIVPTAKIQFNDTGSGAQSLLSVCIPDIGGEWYYLGQVAFRGDGEDAEGNTLLVQEIYPGSGALVDVQRWEKVWDDHGSKKDKDYNLWRGVAYNPVKYHVLSDFFRGQVSDQYAPHDEETAGIKAVATSCLVRGKAGKMIWSDEKSGAADSASVWTIVPQTPSEAIDMSDIQPYFVSVKSHNKPNRPVYVLKKSAVEFQTD